MRKFFLMAAALVMAVCSCSQDEVLENVVSTPEGSFKAVIENSSSTRTYLGGDYGTKVFWKAGDKVSINGSIYTAATGGGDSTVLDPVAEDAEPDSEGKYTAYYPSSLTSPAIPAVQEFIDGTNASLPMMAVSETEDLSFENLGAVLAIKITPTEELTQVKSIRVSSNKTMSGALDPDTYFLVDDPDAPKTVTLSMENAVSLTEATIFHIAVPAGEYEDLDITVSDGYNGYSMVTRSGTEICMSRNTLYPINFNAQSIIHNYLVLTALNDNSKVGFESGSSISIFDLYYSMDKGTTWNEVTSNFTDIALNEGESVWFKGDNTFLYSDNGYVRFAMDGKIKVSGNIMSLLDGDNTGTEISVDYAFAYLFHDCTALVDAKDLYLPATTLAESCYSSMFYGCSALESAPALPATALAEYCYESMFFGCEALEIAPELPATTLAADCYYWMFAGCYSLDTPPALPATTLAEECYRMMFAYCNSLETAPELPATTLAVGCYDHMFYDCTALETAPELPATTLAEGCYGYMFNGCSALVTAPELPATTLAEDCYHCMFSGCSALVTAPALSATTLAEDCYCYMFYNCVALETAPALPATTLAKGCYSYMFSGCEALETAPALPATTLDEGCYLGMFNYCVALVTAPELPATTLTDYCYEAMFSDCSALEIAPELPAATLTKECYYGMFGYCGKLASVTMLATNVNADDCLTDFLSYAGGNATNPVLFVDESMVVNNTIVQNKGNFTIMAKN